MCLIIFLLCYLKKILFEQNNTLLTDIVIDEICSAVEQFVPQVFLSRKNVQLISDGANVIAKIKYMKLDDYSTNMFDINLTDYEVLDK